MSRLIRRCAAAALGIVVAGLTAALPSAAAPAEPIVLDPGIACAFGLQIDGFAGDREIRGPTDRHVIMAGKGFNLTFTNLSTGKSLTLDSNGSVQIKKDNGDGTQTVTNLGHNVIILFPTDVPAGPSTTLYVGSVVYTVDRASGVFTVKTHSGTTTDICAALSQRPG
jgi:hypothetical protein